MNYYLVQPVTIWKWGTIEALDKKTFCRKEALVDSLDLAVEYCYSKIEGIVDTLKSLRDGSLENVKLMEEVLQEEKVLAKEAARTYKKFSSQLRNINIEKMLERQGIVDD